MLNTLQWIKSWTGLDGAQNSRSNFVLNSRTAHISQGLVWTLLPNDKYWNRSMLLRTHKAAKISLVSLGI